MTDKDPMWWQILCLICAMLQLFLIMAIPAAITIFILFTIDNFNRMSKGEKPISASEFINR